MGGNDGGKPLFTHEIAKAFKNVIRRLWIKVAGRLIREKNLWTIRKGTKAPGAAGKIHSDFERGFIRAEVTAWQDRVELKTEAACRAAAKTSTEGKEYVVRDGDVMFFKFNV